MIKSVYTSTLSAILGKLLELSEGLWPGPFCLFFLGEPDIDIPEE